VAAAADTLGYDGVLLPTGLSCEDAWIVAASLIAVTGQLRFLVAVRPGIVSPGLAARMAVTLDRLSGGRAEVGIGTGGRGRPFAAFGIDGERLVARFTEGLALMKACWTEPEINFDGDFWQLTGAAMEPKPVQQPHPPVWFGGSHPAALARAVRLGDGFFGAGSQPTAAFAQATRVVHDELARQDRDRSSFQIAKRVYVHVGDDPERAQQQIEAALEAHYGRVVTGVSVAGPPAACVAGLQEVAAAGAELILLNPMLDDTEQMERLAAEVIPALAGAPDAAGRP